MSDKVTKYRQLNGRIEVTSLYSNTDDWNVVRQGELKGAEGFKPVADIKVVKDLNVTVSGMAANKTLKTLTETSGKIAAEFEDISITSSQINDKTDSYSETGEVVVTGKALKAALDTLEVAEAGSDGSYIKKVSETAGKISAAVQGFDTTFDNATNKNAPTTLAVQNHVAAEINKLEVASVGADGSYLKTISEAGGKISASAATFDTAISTNSEITAPTTKAVKTYVDSHAASTSGHANATTTANGFMSATDKAHHDTMWSVWTADGADNTLVDKVQEVLTVFNEYPEGTTIVNALAGKSDTSHTHGNIANGGTLSAAKMVVVTDGDYKITTSSTITTTELGYLDGVTSNIQTQLNGKVDENTAITGATKCKITYDTKGLVTAGADLAASDIPALDTSKITSGTMDTARLPKATSTAAGTVIPSTGLNNSSGTITVIYAGTGTASSASHSDHVHGNINNDGILSAANSVVITDDTGKVTASSNISSTELSTLAGVTSSIQTQLDNKVEKNANIAGATKCKITYDAKGLVTAGADLAASDIPSLATSKITSGTFADERIASAAAWNAKYDKPAAGIPASDLVNLASNKITSMTDYTKATSVSAVTTSDSLNSAIGKLEKALDGKAATEHGTHVTTATVKEALGTGTGTSKYLREDGTWVTPPNDNDNNTYKIIVSNTSASSSDSHVANNTNGNSYIILHDTSINSAAASLNIAGYDGVSVTNTNTGVIKFTGNAATNSTYGVVKSAANRTEVPTLITGENATGRFYGVELDSNGKMFVNVPWTDSSLGTGHTHATTVEKLESEDDSAIKLQFGKSYALTAGGEICNFTIDSYTVTAAAEGGHDVSLVTTGEKYIWNNKQDAISDLATIRSDASTGATHATSTHARTDATKVEASATNGNIKIDDSEVTVYTHPTGTNPHGTTAFDVGLGNVGNFKAVSTVASQGLTDAEKSNARANIGAFEGYTSSNKLAANLVSEDTSHRFVTDAEKETWNTTLKGKIENGVLTITNM